MTSCAAFLKESRMSFAEPSNSTGNPGQSRDLRFHCPWHKTRGSDVLEVQQVGGSVAAIWRYR